jgi:ankyrin repeat protein
MVDFNDSPPWHFAALNEDERVMARVIADGGCDVDARNSLGESIAMLAAQNDNEQVLKLLIAAGADLSARDLRGCTVMHIAAANSNVNVMAQLIELCTVDVVNELGEMPCMIAAEHGNHGVLELLIGAGADVHAVSNDGLSVGVRGLKSLNERTVELLVDAKIDVNTVEPETGLTAMFRAVAWCNHRLLAKLIAAGGDVNATAKDQKTPCHSLIVASERSAEDALRTLTMLIDAKANVHALDENQLTPLHCVAYAGHSDCVALLLKGRKPVRAVELGHTVVVGAKSCHCQTFC